MKDKIFYPLAAIVAIALIAFSLVWPQGQGRMSPKPFGHAIEMPDWYRMDRERTQRQIKEAADKAQKAAQAASNSAAAASSSASASAH